VCKERRLPLPYAAQPLHRFTETASEALELPRCPSAECPVQVFEHRVKGRAAVAAVVVALSVLRPPEPEREPEEVELLVVVVSPPVIVLAVDGRRFLPVDGQLTSCKPFLYPGMQPLGLALTLAVADDVVGVALEGDVRVLLGYSCIKRVMEKEVGEQGAYDPSLRRSLSPFFQPAVLVGHRDREPSANTANRIRSSAEVDTTSRCLLSLFLYAIEYTWRKKPKPTNNPGIMKTKIISRFLPSF